MFALTRLLRVHPPNPEDFVCLNYLSKFLHILRTLCLLVPYLLPECCLPVSTLTTFPSSPALFLQPSPLPSPSPTSLPHAQSKPQPLPPSSPASKALGIKPALPPAAPPHTAKRQSHPSPVSRPQQFPGTPISRGDEGREQQEAAGALLRGRDAILREEAAARG